MTPGDAQYGIGESRKSLPIQTGSADLHQAHISLEQAGFHALHPLVDGFRRSGIRSDPVLRRQLQCMNDRATGRRGRPVIKVGHRRPDQRLALQGLRLTLPGFDPKYMQQHVDSGIGERNSQVLSRLPDLDTQFLVEFPRQSSVRGLSVLQFPARKFPKVLKVHTLTPLREKDASIRALQDTHRHLKGFFRIGIRH